LKIAAALVGLLALACFGAAVWLLWVLWQFAHSDAYAPDVYVSFAYSTANVEADGSGIYAPAILLFAVSGFLAKFAWNLWRE
jgi:hypothetical protein